MPCERNTEQPDFGIIATISLPPESLVPDPVTGASGPQEYDRYFRIDRVPGGLQEWSRTCVTLTQKVLDDLRENGGGLDDRDERDLLKGFLVLTQTTLDRWATAATTPDRSATAADEDGAERPDSR